eukprot:11442404-Heterocapsa_arctica.AAC.1
MRSFPRVPAAAEGSRMSTSRVHRQRLCNACRTYNNVTYYGRLCYTILYCTSLYDIALYYNILWSTMQHFALNCIIVELRHMLLTVIMRQTTCASEFNTLEVDCCDVFWEFPRAAGTIRH